MGNPLILNVFLISPPFSFLLQENFGLESQFPKTAMQHDHLLNSLRYPSLTSTSNTKGLVHFQRQLSTPTATLIHIPVEKGHRVHLGFHGFQSFLHEVCPLSSCSLPCHGFAPSDSLHMYSGVRRKSLELLRTLCIKSL